MALGIPTSVIGFFRPTDAWFYDRYIAPALLQWVYRASLDLDASFARARRVLDVGCGGGQYLCEVALRHPHVAIAGVDSSPDMVGRANARLAQMDRPASVVVGSALDLPFADGEFDVVVSVASIKHWQVPERGLAECCRVLGPGGTLLVVEADRGARLEDVEGFVANLAFPRTVKPALPALVPFVRTFVHGRSLDLEEARALARTLPLEDARAERVTEAPALRILGTKRG
ncbi:MAG: class I SAM-dependent methyltransferase [Polyangiaceae bacterium]